MKNVLEGEKISSISAQEISKTMVVMDARESVHKEPLMQASWAVRGIDTLELLIKPCATQRHRHNQELDSGAIQSAQTIRKDLVHSVLANAQATPSPVLDFFASSQVKAVHHSLLNSVANSNKSCNHKACNKEWSNYQVSWETLPIQHAQVGEISRLLLA